MKLCSTSYVVQIQYKYVHETSIASERASERWWRRKIELEEEMKVILWMALALSQENKVSSHNRGGSSGEEI